MMFGCGRFLVSFILWFFMIMFLVIVKGLVVAGVMLFICMSRKYVYFGLIVWYLYFV
jgi:hypothetical protein